MVQSTRVFSCKCNPNMVWIAEEIKEVMTTTTRLETVEAIVDTEGTTSFSAEILNSMKKLMLKGTSLGVNLHVSLNSLEIIFGDIEQLQIDKKVILTNLKFINLLASSITSFPDVSGLPNLERLELTDCEQLVEVHESVFLHERIIHLSLTYCPNLETPPPCIWMKSLRYLCLQNCRSLEQFPEISKETGRLSVLDISACETIRTLPSSIRLLTGLTVLTVSNCNLDLSSNFKENLCMQGLTQFSCLRILDLQGNNIVDSDFPRDLHNTWPSMEELDLSCNLMACVPTSISQPSYLKCLTLSRCKNLKELRQLPSLIQILKADSCLSLEKIEDFSQNYKWLFQITLGFRPKLKKADTKSLLMKSFVQKCAAMKH